MSVAKQVQKRAVVMVRDTWLAGQPAVGSEFIKACGRKNKRYR